MWSQTVLTSCGPESKELGEEDWRLEDKVLTSAPDGREGLQTDMALQGWGWQVAEVPEEEVQEEEEEEEREESG